MNILVNSIFGSANGSPRLLSALLVTRSSSTSMTYSSCITGSLKFFVTLSLMFLGMLKPWLMRTTTNKEAVTVLLEEADKLYVHDIRKCLVLFSANRKDFYRLAEGNTNYILTEKEPPKEEKKPAEEEANTEAETNDDDNKEDTADAEVEENQDGQNNGDVAENKNEEGDEKKPEEETLMDKVEDAIDAVGL